METLVRYYVKTRDGGFAPAARAAPGQSSTDDLKLSLLRELSAGDVDSVALAERLGASHEAIVGAIKSLASLDYVKMSERKCNSFVLTEEALDCVAHGTPEYRVFKHVKAKGPLTQEALEAALGKELCTLRKGFGVAMKAGWVKLDKATKQVSAGEAGDDAVRDALALVRETPDEDAVNKMKLAGDLKKRKLVELKKLTALSVSKGPDFQLEIKKADAELTAEMVQTGAWKTAKFKSYNLNALGADIQPGCLHPLMKVKAEIRQVLLLMGFQEMATNRFVESSFWNFDTLFQPQQHPARDAHDTFFISDPKRAQNIPKDYLERVRTMHQTGGTAGIEGAMPSKGWGYDWSEEEAMTTILRTHTTAVSARTLYEFGQEYQKTGVWVDKKCFSIDRVFRNETIDATHLAEFHQVEGFVAARGLTLGHMIGLFKEFFQRAIGMTNLKFKPAYNPYTEPSMEIFGFHPGLNKWIEIGNSGIFRPEMLLPMGLPADVKVMAWGISCERPTMIQYGIGKIAKLFGAKMDVTEFRQNPFPMFDSHEPPAMP